VINTAGGGMVGSVVVRVSLGGDCDGQCSMWWNGGECGEQ